MADPIKLPPGATLVSDGTMKLPPGATLVTGSGNAPPPQQGFFGSALDSSGLTSLGHLLTSPKQTLKGIPQDISDAINNTTSNVRQGLKDFKQSGLSQTTRRDFGRAVPIIGPALATAQAQHDSGNNSGMAGTLAGTIAGLAAPSLLKGGLEAAAPTLRATGDAAQDAGAGIMNRTAGSLKADFKRGANPGRAYLDAGGGPALSMQSLATKAADLKSAVGGKAASLRNAATSAGTVIPTDRVLDVLNPPIAKAVSLEMGPGGMNNVAPIQRYAESFTPALNDAKQAGGFTPDALFRLKKGIADNTNWSDPTQFSLKSVRQQQAGGLGGLLGDEVPGLKPLNSQYQGLSRFAARTQERANTNSVPLSGIALKTGLSALGAGTGEFTGHPILGAALGLATDSVPFKTALATGLYRGGRGLSAVPDLVPVPRLYPAAMAIPGYRLNAGSKKQNGNDGE